MDKCQGLCREVCPELDRVLQAVGARRMVIGHTVQEEVGMSH